MTSAALTLDARANWPDASATLFAFWANVVASDKGLNVDVTAIGSSDIELVLLERPTSNSIIAIPFPNKARIL